MAADAWAGWSVASVTCLCVCVCVCPHSKRTVIWASDVNKDSRLKAKARTKDWDFVLKDNQGPRPRTTSLIWDVNSQHQIGRWYTYTVFQDLGIDPEVTKSKIEVSWLWTVLSVWVCMSIWLLRFVVNVEWCFTQIRTSKWRGRRRRSLQLKRRYSTSSTQKYHHSALYSFTQRAFKLFTPRGRPPFLVPNFVVKTWHDKYGRIAKKVYT